MRAWEMEQQMIREAVPSPAQDQDAAWSGIGAFEEQNDQMLKMQWETRVPGSQAPERLMVAAVQAMENRGMVVPGGESLVTEGLEALEAGDFASLHLIHLRLQEALGGATGDPDHPYWGFERYDSFEELEPKLTLPKLPAYDGDSKEYEERLYAGWLAQIIAGALGTALEGYNTDALKAAFGEIRDFVVPPSTFNDDVTFELAFLKAVERTGRQVSSREIAEMWVALIPFGWSAELVALRNLRQGIMPPESGTYRNPFYEWVGAQMRGAVCGLVAPGDPLLAARLAWTDGEVSHAYNGILGEIFNALLVSMSFIIPDARELVTATVNAMPERSEYAAVVRYALAECRSAGSWEPAWRRCEERLERYNWVHAYPNAAAQVVALWFGNGDFDETLHINAMCGQDVDCSAAQALTALGIQIGVEAIPTSWREPIGDRLRTYVRGMKELSIRELAAWTAEVAEKLR